MGNACWWKLKYLETQTSLSSLHNSTKDKKQQMAENLAKDYYCLKHIFIIKKTFFFWLYSVALMHFWYSLSVLFIVVQAHVRRSKLFCKLQMPWHIYAAFLFSYLSQHQCVNYSIKWRQVIEARLYLSPVV